MGQHWRIILTRLKCVREFFANHSFWSPSYNLLVPEEIFQVPYLQVRRHKHDQNWHNSENDDATLDFLILWFKAFLADYEHGELRSELLDHILDFLRLKLYRAQMLLRDNICVIGCLHAGLKGKSVIDGWPLAITLVWYVLYANLVIARVKRCKVMPHRLFLK